MRGASAPRPTASCRRVSVIVAAYAEQEVIADAGRQPARARLPGRAARGDRRLRRLARRDRGAGPRGRRRPGARAAARRQDPRPGRRASSAPRGEIVAFSDANVTWEPDALRRLVAPFADPRVGYVCGEVQLVDAARDQPGGALLALRDGAARARVARALGDRRQRRDLRHPARVLPGRRPDHGPRPLVPVQHGQARLAAPCTCREARASEKMVPTIEGEFARKRRMMSHTWPIVLRGGMLSPRGYDPLYALMIFSHRILRYLSPFLHLIALGTSIALLGQRLGVRGRARGAGSRCCCGARSRGVVPARPLLIARYYVLTTASLAAGLWDWLRAARRRAGSRRRERGELFKRLLDVLLVGGVGSVTDARRWSPLLALAIRLESPGHPIYRQTRVGQGRRAVSDLQAAHDGPRRRVHRRRAGDPGGRRPDHAGRARSCAATRSTSCRTCGTCCAARCRSSGRGRRSPSRSSSTPSASAGGWRSSRGSPAGRRSTAAPRCRGPSGSSSTSGTSSTARWRSTCGSWRGRSGWCSAGTGSTRERGADGTRRAQT